MQTENDIMDKHGAFLIDSIAASGATIIAMASANRLVDGSFMVEWSRCGSCRRISVL